MALTSVDAYRETVLSGRACTQRERILAFVRWRGAGVSRGDIAIAFSDKYRTYSETIPGIGYAPWLTMGTWDGGSPIPLASVCGRVNVLVRSGMLRELKGAGRGPMGDPVNLVEAVMPEPRQRTFADFARPIFPEGRVG